jgi:hypothetical protein
MVDATVQLLQLTYPLIFDGNKRPLALRSLSYALVGKTGSTTGIRA